MLKSPPLVATLSDSMRMSPCSWGDIFTWPLRGDRIIGLRHRSPRQPSLFHHSRLCSSRTLADPQSHMNTVKPSRQPDGDGVPISNDGVLLKLQLHSDPKLLCVVRGALERL